MFLTGRAIRQAQGLVATGAVRASHRATDLPATTPSADAVAVGAVGVGGAGLTIRSLLLASAPHAGVPIDPVAVRVGRAARSAGAFAAKVSRRARNRCRRITGSASVAGSSGDAGTKIRGAGRSPAGIAPVALTTRAVRKAKRFGPAGLVGTPAGAANARTAAAHATAAATIARDRATLSILLRTRAPEATVAIAGVTRGVGGAGGGAASRPAQIPRLASHRCASRAQTAAAAGPGAAHLVGRIDAHTLIGRAGRPAPQFASPGAVALTICLTRGAAGSHAQTMGIGVARGHRTTGSIDHRLCAGEVAHHARATRG